MIDSMVLPSIWNVPYQRNPFFTGREETLTHIHKSLQADSTVALTQPQAISGLGGIGKTQTAIEYAYRYHADYHAVLWVRADTYNALVSGFVILAHLLNLSAKDERDQNRIVEEVMFWLRMKSNWLLIFDNVDDITVASTFIPTAHRGHILLTTRAQALGQVAHSIKVEKMYPEVGGLFLLRRAGLLPLQADFDSAKGEDRRLALEITQVVDGLPLALDQAGAYIKQTRKSLSDYLDLYRTRHADLLKTHGGFDSDYPESVATTWSLSFEKVTRANPASADLLYLSAFLYAEAIPEEIIIDGAPHLGPILQPVASHPLQLDGAFKERLKFSLLHREADAQTFSIHRLVQAVLKDRMENDIQRQWAERTVRAVNEALPEADFAFWPVYQRCILHAQVCAAHIEQWQMKFIEAARLLAQSGIYFHSSGQYREGIPLLQQALQICEQTQGAESFETSLCLHELAELHRDLGEKARPLLEHSLAIREKGLGKKHPHTGSVLNNLAELYQTEGKYELAEQFYQRSLAIAEQVEGPEHPDTASALNNLGFLYKIWGKHDLAEQFYQKALAIRERVMGLEHMETATSYHNLAGFYLAMSRYEEAEQFYQKALAIRERVLGPEHPDIAATLNNFAMLYADQEKYEQAEQLYRRALLICETVFGSEHPNMAHILSNLAEIRLFQHDYMEAQDLFQRALAIDEQTAGYESREVATHLYCLATVFHAQGHYEQAKRYYEDTIALCERVLEPTHPDIQMIRNAYATLFTKDRGDLYGDS